MSMNATVRWVDGLLMTGESGSGHALVMDGPEAFGGRDLGIRPMEMMLIGMGGCMMIDIITILEKMQEIPKKCRAEIQAERAADHPKVFTEIHIHFIFAGDALNQKKLAKAVSLSANKYCSALAMLAKTAKIRHDFSLSDA